MKKTKQWSKNLRNQKGITLISLVITIVVLIILAGVAINLTLGENGILKKAEYAREQHKMAEVKEKVELSILDIQTEKLGSGEKCTIDTLVSELPGKLNGLTITKDGEGAKGTYNDCDFTIDSNLNVTINGYNPSEGGNTSGGAHTHSYTETITKAATCTEAGEKTLTCSCGDSKIETIPASHNYVNDVCTGCNQTVDGYTAFTLTSSNYSQAGITREGDVIIPQTFEYEGVNYKVTKIGDYAFFRCSNLTTIEIPEGVTNIGTEVFYECSNLAKIEMPESLISIGFNAFYKCTSLNNVKIPEGVINIDSQAFFGCNGLTSIGCTGSGASIELPSTLSKIEDYLFQACKGLITVELPERITSIGTAAFAACSEITSVKMPNTLLSIGESAFASCEKLQTITIGKKVNSIGVNAFENCIGLKSVSILSEQADIGNGAFYDCAALEVIRISKGIKNFNGSMFTGCTSLKTINYEGTQEEWDNINKSPTWNSSCPDDMQIVCNYTD